MNMAATPAAWFTLVTGAMRLGYATRGFVYGLVGLAALRAAASDTAAPGLLSALSRLRETPWSQPVLLAVAAGLVAYSLWRGLDSAIDLAGHGRGFGWVERGGLFFVALLHLAFAWFAARAAFDGGGGLAEGDGSRMAHVIAGLIGDPLGRGFVVLVGVGTVSFGAYSIRKGVLCRYRLHMRRTAALVWAAPLLGFGLAARGVVLAIMGGFIVWSAWALDPTAAGGYGDTLDRIRGVVHGRLLLGFAGAGMVAFAVYCFVEAACRVIPPRPAPLGARHGRESFGVRRSGWTTDP